MCGGHTRNAQRIGLAVRIRPFIAVGSAARIPPGAVYAGVRANERTYKTNTTSESERTKRPCAAAVRSFREKSAHRAHRFHVYVLMRSGAGPCLRIDVVVGLPENCLYPPRILCFHHFTRFPAIFPLSLDW